MLYQPMGLPGWGPIAQVTGKAREEGEEAQGLPPCAGFS